MKRTMLLAIIFLLFVLPSNVLAGHNWSVIKMQVHHGHSTDYKVRGYFGTSENHRTVIVFEGYEYLNRPGQEIKTWTYIYRHTTGSNTTVEHNFTHHNGYERFMSVYRVPSSWNLGDPLYQHQIKMYCHFKTNDTHTCTRQVPAPDPTDPPITEPVDPNEQHDPIEPDPIVIETVAYTNSFVDYRDEYRLDYWDWPEETDRYVLEFLSSSNQFFDKEYNHIPTGTHYLTCNGTYTLNFYNGNDLIGSTGDILTSQMINPTCDSYAAEDLKDDLGLTVNDLGDGDFNLSWNGQPGADVYEIYKDGNKIGETTQTDYDVSGYGGYTVRAVDDNDNTIGESDVNTVIYYNNPIGGSCDACQKIRDMLACPDWNQYMGAWSQMIQDSLPPPPDWQAISDIFATTFINHFDNFIGDMPDTPTVAELQPIIPDTPIIDTDIDGIDDLVPIIPDDFADAPIDFDLSQAPVIEIIDDSEPFIFNDPIANINSSGVGVKVLPGNPANHTDGIDLPAQAPEVDPLPIPNEINTAPPVNMPTPTQTSPGSGGGSIPNTSNSDMPIPDFETNF